MPYAAVTLAFISTPNALHVFTLIASWSTYAMASFSRNAFCFFFVANLYYDPIKRCDGLKYQREFLIYDFPLPLVNVFRIDFQLFLEIIFSCSFKYSRLLLKQ